MKKAFIAEGLINKDSINLSFDTLMRNIIRDLFVQLPISIRKLSRYIIIAYELLEDFFIKETLEYLSMYMSESSLKAKVSESID